MSSIDNPSASILADQPFDSIILDSTNQDVIVSRSAAGVLKVRNTSDPTHWITIGHNGTNGVITTNVGTLILSPISIPGLGSNSERFGAGAATTGGNSLAAGFGASAALNSVALGYNASASSSVGIAIGPSASAGPNAVTIGSLPLTATQAVVVGIGASTVNATVASVVVGYGAYAINGVAIGTGATSSGGGVSIGPGATGGSGVAIGTNATIGGVQGAVVIGDNAVCATGAATVVGKSASGTATYSTVYGQSASVNGTASFGVAVGFGASATGGEGVTVGSYSTSSTAGAAVGNNSNAGIYAVALGRYAVASSYSVAIGYQTSASSGIAIGEQAVATSRQCMLGGKTANSFINEIIFGRSGGYTVPEGSPNIFKRIRPNDYNGVAYSDVPGYHLGLETGKGAGAGAAGITLSTYDSQPTGTAAHTTLVARLSLTDALIAIGGGTEAITVAAAAGQVGFFGSTGAVKSAVTGSRGGNAALASLLTLLASHNLLTDSSTA